MKTGECIKKLRKERNLTLVKLSKLSGVAVATLSRMESNKMIGTLEAYASLCKAFGITLSEFFRGWDSENADIRLKEVGDIVVNKSQYSVLNLAVKSKGKMKPILIDLKPKSSLPDEQSKSGCEKLIYIMDGDIVVSVAGANYSLKKGNSLYFNSSISHKIKNISNKEAKVFSVES